MAACSPSAGPLEQASTALMQFNTIDPLSDGRWDALVASHPRASVFHDRGWLKALAETYGYRPIALTSAPAGIRLLDGIVFCQVRSWITGTRLVSVPFADHCEPLLNQIGDYSKLTEWICAESSRRHWKYIELRPLAWDAASSPPLAASQSFWFHTLDLRPSLEHIFRSLHKNSVQRRIRRAEREQWSYETGHSEPLLDDFYRLLVLTRRRHGLLPQPRVWFRNLVACLGEKVQIRLVRKDNAPIAAILALRHRTNVVYKYGCSDERFHHLAVMPFLFWKLIEESKAAGAEQIDFGRTEIENGGLTTFKDRFGTSRRQLTYFRYPGDSKEKDVRAVDLPAARWVFNALPNVLLPWAGRLVYRHMG
jgi:CelD/BcsL family acetyltransferase involved in cellulose biosynthesis